MKIGFRAQWHGLRCLELVAEEEDPSPVLFRSLASVAERLRDDQVVDGVVTSYRSLAVYWDKLPETGSEARVLEVAGGDFTHAGDVRRHAVSVCYHGEDLARVAGLGGMSEEDVVRIHTSSVYTVAAIGFLPYFGYLWGLAEELVTPRLALPRPRVPKGAVGIGGGQTGIYPEGSPGGWNLIGQVGETECDEVCRELKVGDELCFEVL